MEDYIPAGDMTPFARCFNQSKGENLDLLDEDKYTAVEAYRIYYMRDKASFAKWGGERLLLTGGSRRS